MLTRQSRNVADVRWVHQRPIHLSVRVTNVATVSSTSKISRSQDIIIPNIPKGLNTCWNHEWRERGRNNNVNMLCLNTEMRATHTIQIQNPWDKKYLETNVALLYLLILFSLIFIIHRKHVIKLEVDSISCHTRWYEICRRSCLAQQARILVQVVQLAMHWIEAACSFSCIRFKTFNW